jgi:molybdenum cofactor cytidylyltransferase/nicotine blue oxidoreductase
VPVGLVLAAGAGSRYGGPKALVVGLDGEGWLARAVAVLRDGGCSSVGVVLGAEAEQARRLLPADAAVQVVVSERWADGLSASLASGLAAAEAGNADAVVITLVDLPALTAEAVRRVIASVGATSSGIGRATYAGAPGHPVLLGRDHWRSVIDLASGDSGARDYLADAATVLVGCDDLGGGDDVDEPDGSGTF